MKKKYSISIYTGGFKGKWSDLTKKGKADALQKQWYVRWSYRNPDTGKMERQLNIYGDTNGHKTYRERMQILWTHRDSLIHLLRHGYSPFDETEDPGRINTMEAIEKAMELKRPHMKPASFVRLKSDIGKFKKYLKAKGFDRQYISAVGKQDIVKYLNESLKHVSARSRNNYRTNIGSLWQIMEDNAMVDRNFVKSIPMLKSKPQRNKTYTDAQVFELFAYMDKNCPNLLLFVKFVSYQFLRPIEVVRLTVDSFDLRSKTVTVMVKQGSEKIKTIPEILLNELPDMEGKKGFLFTREGFLGDWDVSEDAKRGHFSREFRKVKERFGLGTEFGLYSFRHWATSKIYRSLRKDYTPFETKSRMMLITGHGTISALEKYLRSIDAEVSEDYSGLL